MSEGTDANSALKALFAEMARAFAIARPDDARTLVWGEGDPGARVALVGEAPGAQEAAARRPFVGKAGKNLDAFLDMTGFSREELYITNAVKVRPTRVSPAGRVVNRPPDREEIDFFLPWLRREIALVAPRCVVTMGNTALRAWTGGSQTIGEVHGQARREQGLWLYPIYHPASLIYNPGLREIYAEDLARLREFFW